MKKVLALILTLLMVVGCFTGCGEEAKDQTDWEYIQEKGEMVVGITYFSPMNYLDEEGNLTGFETEFAEAVAEKLGVKVKFQVIEWKLKETELNSKNIDCIWNGMTIDDDRKANMEITIPYMNNKQVLVTKAENADTYNSVLGLNGANVVAEEGSAGETVATTDETFAGSNFTPVGAQSDVLLEIKSGTSDAGIIDYVMSIGSIGEGTDYADLVAVDSMSFAPEEYGVAFRKGSDAAEKVNEAMRELAKDGTLNTIATKYKLQDLSLTNVITSLLIGGIILLIT
ncbi:MAG: transporter substrate-binding domain-containing protein [Ruminococcaceae bacterium]|nr:transporter substrate-binding domain-containing protein [Oscillospiraceae bacterium]